MNFLVDYRTSDIIISNLKKYGNIYKSYPLKIEDVAISRHPDIQIHFLTSNSAVCAKGLLGYYRNVLPENIKLCEGKLPVGNTYPDNCAYNIARINNNVICNKKYVDETILNFYKENNYKIHHVNQGYAKCNICPIYPNIILTEDKGIYQTLKEEEELKVIFVPKERVELYGYEYGFLGGATGFADNILLFCGTISDSLKKILLSNNIKYTELSQDTLYDYGSILSFE